MVHKEEFMRGVKFFLEEKLPEMVNYILLVSTPGPDDVPPPQAATVPLRDHLLHLQPSLGPLPCIPAQKPHHLVPCQILRCTTLPAVGARRSILSPDLSWIHPENRGRKHPKRTVTTAG